MLQDFEHFVDCDFDDDLNGMPADDEEPMDGSLCTVETDPSMSDDLKAKIVSCHEEAKAAERPRRYIPTGSRRPGHSWLI